MPMQSPAQSTSSPHRNLNASILSAQARHSFGAMDMMGSQMTFGPNEEIFGESEPSDYVYKVASGAVRTYKILADGRRQIGAFYLPGDIFGLEAGTEHRFSSDAIGRTVVRVVRRSAVLALAPLGLAIETVPRAFSQFVSESAIRLPSSRRVSATVLQP